MVQVIWNNLALINAQAGTQAIISHTHDIIEKLKEEKLFKSAK